MCVFQISNFSIPLIILASIVCHVGSVNYRWLTIEAAQTFIDELTVNEKARALEEFRGSDRRNSSPLITGDGFRGMALPHLCDETNRCRFDHEKMTPGA